MKKIYKTVCKREFKNVTRFLLVFFLTSWLNQSIITDINCMVVISWCCVTAHGMTQKVSKSKYKIRY